MAFHSRRCGAVLIAAALPLLLSACNSTSPDTPAATATAGVVDRSAVYPEITGRKNAATTQMSDEEAAAHAARLSALAGSRRSGAISEAEYRRRLAELDALGANHGRDTLAEISGAN